jgi:hypothetical protein
MFTSTWNKVMDAVDEKITAVKEDLVGQIESYTNQVTQAGQKAAQAIANYETLKSRVSDQEGTLDACQRRLTACETNATKYASNARVDNLSTRVAAIEHLKDTVPGQLYSGKTVPLMTPAERAAEVAQAFCNAAEAGYQKFKQAWIDDIIEKNKFPDVWVLGYNLHFDNLHGKFNVELKRNQISGLEEQKIVKLDQKNPEGQILELLENSSTPTDDLAKVKEYLAEQLDTYKESDNVNCLMYCRKQPVQECPKSSGVVTTLDFSICALRDQTDKMHQRLAEDLPDLYQAVAYRQFEQSLSRGSKPESSAKLFEFAIENPYTPVADKFFQEVQKHMWKTATAMEMQEPLQRYAKAVAEATKEE